jgi:hypothetical protein
MKETPDGNSPCSCGACAPEVPPTPCCCGTETGLAPPIRETTSTLTFANRLDHFLARWGVNRMGRQVGPGLYRINKPSEGSPVFASANYTMSFDALRSALAGIPGYILVLDTKGINVWCAAGKGTFGTAELVRRIGSTGLKEVVSHRTVILPQLGAPGVSAHEVARKTGFFVEYGPVRARDLPKFLETHTATPEMRAVRFPLRDRIVLAPMELVQVLVPLVLAAALLFVLAGWAGALVALAAVLAGTVLFPILLPFIPTRDFSTKGLILGLVVAVPFAGFFLWQNPLPGLTGILSALAVLLAMPAVTAYLALNFTGSTTFTSRTGVKKEIYRYIPVMAFMAGAGLVTGIVLGILRLSGVA